ncbi:hypothetical protein [Afipia felis]|uniref:hypothetical protein n=1 Tax=Afipia felis TaxID=1035 RepID=UPI001FCEC853|nr:hypothetical protein [Afipia felis]
MRRTVNSIEDTGRSRMKPGIPVLNKSGITTSLQTMVLRATEVTMTMPVAADSPPMKAMRLST